jgi:AcrR family transcriptional regulator
MRTSKRMIYYYFGDKEGVFTAVLENAYSSVRAIEALLALEALEPEEALRNLVEQTSRMTTPTKPLSVLSPSRTFIA